MAQSKVVSWFKGLFKAKPTAADLRPFAISDATIAETKKKAELFKTGGKRAVLKYERKQAQLQRETRPSYPPSRPTDGYQPAAKRLVSPSLPG